MPSYLSSTQTSGPSRVMISVASSAGEASMNLRGWKSASDAVARASSRARPASRPTSPTSIPAHLTSSSGRSKARAIAGLDQALAEADPQVATEHLDDVLRGHRVGAFEQAPQDRRLLRRAGGGLDLGERGGHLGECRARLGRRGVAGRAQHLGDGDAQIRRAVVGLGQRGARDVPDLGHGGRDRGPAETRRALVGLGERPAGQEDGGDRQLLGSQGAQVVGDEGGLLGRSSGRREALGQLAPATHAEDGIPCREWCSEGGSRRS